MAREPFFEMIQPDGIYEPSSYVHAVKAGNTVYIAGQVARNEDGELVAPGDAAGQARQVYANLGRVLESAGADWRHVVKITTFLVDRADAADVGTVRREVFGEHRPPHTGVIVAGLGGPDVRMEVEAIAVVPD